MYLLISESRLDTSLIFTSVSTDCCCDDTGCVVASVLGKSLNNNSDSGVVVTSSSSSSSSTTVTVSFTDSTLRIGLHCSCCLCAKCLCNDLPCMASFTLYVC